MSEKENIIGSIKSVFNLNGMAAKDTNCTLNEIGHHGVLENGS